MLKNIDEVNMKKLAISVRQYIDMERVADLLNGALDTACGSSYYWVEWLKEKTIKPITLEFMYDKDRVTIYRNIDYPLNSTGSIVLIDTESEKEYILNLKNVKKGLAIMAKKYPSHYADFLNDNEDGITSDVFLQCCIFGDIIYG